MLMAIKQASYQLGAATPSLIYCDSATNFLPIQQLDGDGGDDVDPGTSKKLMTDLKKALHSQRITLKASTPRSSWRNSIAESMVRCFKLAMKKSGLDQKSFTTAQWQYVSSKIQFLVNSRPLNVKYMEDNLCVLTPAHLVFGSRKGIFPNNMELEDDSRLFSKLMSLDKQILAFEDAWFQSYANELTRWTKFKHRSRTLETGDVVFMLDRINSETKQPTLAIIKEVLSNRTYTVEYQKKSMRIDPSTYKVVKSARRYTVQRPAQQLCYITSSSCNEEIQVDPFVSSDHNLPVANPDELGDDIPLEGMEAVADTPPSPIHDLEQPMEPQPEQSCPADVEGDLGEIEQHPGKTPQVVYETNAPVISDIPKKGGRKPRKS